MAFNLFASSPAKFDVGGVAPDFTVQDTDAVELVLSALVERGPVVLAFYPKAFTPG